MGFRRVVKSILPIYIFYSQKYGFSPIRLFVVYFQVSFFFQGQRVPSWGQPYPAQIKSDLPAVLPEDVNVVLHQIMAFDEQGKLIVGHHINLYSVKRFPLWCFQVLVMLWPRSFRIWIYALNRVQLYRVIASQVVNVFFCRWSNTCDMTSFPGCD